MPIYSYSIRNADDNHREETGTVALPCDAAAREFADAVIRDMLCDNTADYFGWMMVVAKDELEVCTLALSI